MESTITDAGIEDSTGAIAGTAGEEKLGREEQQPAREQQRRVWTQPMVANMLRSVVYIGDYLSNKEICIMTEDGPKRVKNDGHTEQTYLQGHHEPIVSPELFDIVQQMMDSRLLNSRRIRFSPADVELLGKAREIADTEERRMKLRLEEIRQSL